jgi:hypothetical protein
MGFTKLKSLPSSKGPIQTSTLHQKQTPLRLKPLPPSLQRPAPKNAPRIATLKPLPLSATRVGQLCNSYLPEKGPSFLDDYVNISHMDDLFKKSSEFFDNYFKVMPSSMPNHKAICDQRLTDKLSGFFHNLEQSWSCAITQSLPTDPVMLLNHESGTILTETINFPPHSSILHAQSVTIDEDTTLSCASKQVYSERAITEWLNRNYRNPVTNEGSQMFLSYKIKYDYNTFVSKIHAFTR